MSCEFPRLRWAMMTAFHTSPMEMEEIANSIEVAPSPRGHLSMTALETWDSPQTSLLHCEVPAPRTGHYTEMSQNLLAIPHRSIVQVRVRNPN